MQQNGNITLPLVGDLKAGGLTPVQIEDEITKALTKYIVKPLVTVTVQEVGSRRYYMDGQIALPANIRWLFPLLCWKRSVRRVAHSNLPTPRKSMCFVATSGFPSTGKRF